VGSEDCAGGVLAVLYDNSEQGAEVESRWSMSLPVMACSLTVDLDLPLEFFWWYFHLRTVALLLWAYK